MESSSERQARTFVPEAGTRPELTEPGLAELEPKHHLGVHFVGVHFAGSLKAVTLVEGDRAALALSGARGQHLDSGPATEVLNDQVERRGAEAMPLVTLVNEKLPQVVRYVLGTSDLVGDHHEPDRRLLVINRPVQGMSVGVFCGFAQ